MIYIKTLKCNQTYFNHYPKGLDYESIRRNIHASRSSELNCGRCINRYWMVPTQNIWKVVKKTYFIVSFIIKKIIKSI